MDEQVAANTARILARLDQIERKQMLANSRIRQDVASALAILTAALVVLGAISNAVVQPLWWTVILFAAALIYLGFRLVGQVRRQEEPPE